MTSEFVSHEVEAAALTTTTTTTTSSDQSMVTTSVPVIAPTTAAVEAGKKKTKPIITVSAVKPADLADVVTCELLAFPGVDSDVGAHMYPFRAALFTAGLHPKYWPDFQSTIRRRGRKLVSGSEMFKATVVDDSGRVVVVGMAWYAPAPGAAKERRWNRRLLNDYVYPALDTVRSRLWPDTDGMNMEFVNLFKGELIKTRKEIQEEYGEHFIIEILGVHPEYQRRGVGAALVRHCISMADAAGLPVYLEASKAGIALYEYLGFKTVRECSIVYKGEVIDWPVMIRAYSPNAS